MPVINSEGTVSFAVRSEKTEKYTLAYEVYGCIVCSNYRSCLRKGIDNLDYSQH